MVVSVKPNSLASAEAEGVHVHRPLQASRVAWRLVAMRGNAMFTPVASMNASPESSTGVSSSRRPAGAP
jgi:hypothetical protein